MREAPADNPRIEDVIWTIRTATRRRDAAQAICTALTIAADGQCTPDDAKRVIEAYEAF